MTIPEKESTHFGYQTVHEREKADKVAGVFKKVAPRYDLMNDLMSLGLHRLWKQSAIAEADIKRDQTVLDLASGTGDLAIAMAKIVGKNGVIYMTDINEAMLSVGRDRLTDKGILQPIHYMLVDAEQIPLPSDSIDRITMAFGLRNVTHKDVALAEMYRVLKPGGKLMVLEFSKPENTTLASIYDMYSFSIIPKLGEWVLNDKDSYQYLVESIRMHPDQTTLLKMMETAGFEDAAYRNLTGGIVAIHTGWKY